MKLHTRKAQAAMEFLMTYGWAILVVLVVIGALAYFGILNPQTLLPERCELQQGFYCKDYRISESGDTITFSFQNGRGRDMMLWNIALQSDDGTITCSENMRDGIVKPGNPPETFAAKPGVHVGNGNAKTIRVEGCTMPDGLANTGKRKFAIQVQWYDFTSTSDFVHTMEGQLLANIEK